MLDLDVSRLYDNEDADGDASGSVRSDEQLSQTWTQLLAQIKQTKKELLDQERAEGGFAAQAVVSRAYLSSWSRVLARACAAHPSVAASTTSGSEQESTEGAGAVVELDATTDVVTLFLQLISNPSDPNSGVEIKLAQLWPFYVFALAYELPYDLVIRKLEQIIEKAVAPDTCCLFLSQNFHFVEKVLPVMQKLPAGPGGGANGSSANASATTSTSASDGGESIGAKLRFALDMNHNPLLRQ